MSYQVFLTILALLRGVSARAIEPRVYNNPLNAKAVDLFLVVDEANSFLNILQLGQIKIALQQTVVDLNPLGSSPYFGVLFYGATSTVQSVVPFPATSASAVGTKLDQKQFTSTQVNPSKLVSALDAVDSSCRSKCRSTVPRVTVVFSGTLDSSAEARIRQLENDLTMTVIVIGVGRNVNTHVLNQLASQPRQIYAIPFDSFTELLVSTPYVSSVISSVPRFFSIGTFLSVDTLSDVYYTVQINTHQYTLTKDAIVSFTSVCTSCPVFGSLTEPNPTVANTVQSQHDSRVSLFSPFAVWHFRIPQNTKRFFFSLQGIKTNLLNIEFYILPLPDVMKSLIVSNSSTDLTQSVG